jgi:8-oxo-dGTP diphosphatase
MLYFKDMAPYCYDYPRPAVAADIAVFALRNEKLSVLLIKRRNYPFKAKWALPGGFLEERETLDDCARRELREETGINAADIFHFANFSAPDRDPRTRVISIAYFAFVASERADFRAGSDASAAMWFETGDLPDLAFDHTVIIDSAIAALRSDVQNLREGILSELSALLPARPALTDLLRLCQLVSGERIDLESFRDKVRAMRPRSQSLSAIDLGH